MKLRTLRRSVLVDILGSALWCCACAQLVLGQGTPANVANGRFDGTYVPDPQRSNTSVLLGSGQGCPATDPGVAGRGLIVKNSLATFHVGFQQVGARKVKPSEASGNVDSNGKLAISKKMIRIDGQFDGAANTSAGQENSFNGEFIVDFDKHTSCGYSLHLKNTRSSP